MRTAPADTGDHDRLRLSKAVADRTEQTVADIRRTYVPTTDVDGVMGEAIDVMRARMLEVTELARAAVPAMSDADAAVLDNALRRALEVKSYIAIGMPDVTPPPASASRRKRNR